MKGHKPLACVGIVCGILLSVTQAKAELFTFDDVTPDALGSALGNSYHDLQWINFYALNGLTYPFNPSGYQNGVVSGPNVAFNFLGNPATIRSSGHLFDLQSAFLTGAWNDGLQISVVGYRAGIQVYSDTVTVNTKQPTNFDFNFNQVDEVTFTSFGGTSAGFSGTGEHFAMDNLVINDAPVPAPLASVSFAAALLIRRKRPAATRNEKR